MFVDWFNMKFLGLGFELKFWKDILWWFCLLLSYGGDRVMIYVGVVFVCEIYDFVREIVFFEMIVCVSNILGKSVGLL